MKRSRTRRAPLFVTMLTAALIVAGWRVAVAAPCIRDGLTCRTTNDRCCSGVCVKSSKKSFGTCCTPTTCAAVGANCGMIADGCGGTLDCGTCTLPQTCGGGGTPNVCGCSPTTCAAVGANCGMIADGCGGTLDCGTCALPETCGGGGTPNVCGPTVCGNGVIDPGEQCDGASCGTDTGCGSPSDAFPCQCCTTRYCSGGFLPNCCAGSFCARSVFSPVGYCTPFSCTPETGCGGSPFACVDGTCCAGPGQSCINVPCCPGLGTSCVFGLCCLPAGAACVSPSGCCSGSCSAAGTCD
jgi:hypothetical protein